MQCIDALLFSVLLFRIAFSDLLFRTAFSALLFRPAFSTLLFRLCFFRPAFSTLLFRPAFSTLLFQPAFSALLFRPAFSDYQTLTTEYSNKPSMKWLITTSNVQPFRRYFTSSVMQIQGSFRSQRFNENLQTK
jgi:hypothetical protein